MRKLALLMLLVCLGRGPAVLLAASDQKQDQGNQAQNTNSHGNDPRQDKNGQAAASGTPGNSGNSGVPGQSQAGQAQGQGNSSQNGASNGASHQQDSNGQNSSTVSPGNSGGQSQSQNQGGPSQRQPPSGSNRDSHEQESETPIKAELQTSVVDAGGQNEELDNIQYVTATGQPVAGEFIRGGSGFIEAVFSGGLASSSDSLKSFQRIAKPSFEKKPVDSSKAKVAGKVSIMQDRTVVFSPAPSQQVRFRFEGSNPSVSTDTLVAAKDGQTREASEGSVQFQEQDEVVFTNAGDGMDLSYMVRGNRLEEDLVLSHAPTVGTFSFRLDIGGLKPMPQPDGTIYFVDAGSQTPVFYLDKPFMVDSSGARSEGVRLSLSQHDDHTDAQIQSNASWLRDTARAYPVVIDPTIVYLQSQTTVVSITQATITITVTSQSIVTAGLQTVSATIQSMSGSSITVTLPGNSLPIGTQVTIAANANPPGPNSNLGQVVSMSNPVAVDINTDNGSQPNQPVTITMGFKGSDLPASLPASNLKICFFDPVSHGWIPLNSSSVDTTNNTVTALTPHFTSFALLGFTVQSVVDNAVIFPIPWKPGTGDARFDASQVTFTNLPPGASIKIYKLTGELIKGANADGSGTFLWNGTNNSGRTVASGVYPVLLEGGGGRIRKRIVVIR